MDGCLFRVVEDMGMMETENTKQGKKKISSVWEQQSRFERKWKGVEAKDINVLEFWNFRPSCKSTT